MIRIWTSRLKIWKWVRYYQVLSDLGKPDSVSKHDPTPYNTTWLNTKRHKLEKIFFQFFKLFEKIFLSSFWRKKKFPLFVSCYVVSFTSHMCQIVSYWCNTTHLDSLAMAHTFLLSIKYWKVSRFYNWWKRFLPIQKSLALNNKILDSSKLDVDFLVKT